MQVDIDPHAGFCGGVIRAINRAERFLADHPGQPLYSLGAMVHNEEELSRLSAKGLVTVDLATLARDVPGGGVPVLIRAHGEPPSTYETARERSYELLDCTCPVVLKLQKMIREAHERHPSGGQIVIFGRVGHAEVLGLLGQSDKDSFVAENEAMLERLFKDGTLRRDLPTEVFSQTTKSPGEYVRFCAFLGSLMDDPALLTVHDTVCVQVAGRHKELSAFVAEHDVMVFVCGESSSNGTVLFELCKSLNDRTYRISSPASLRPEWFRSGDRVGVSGATSTPKWLLEEVALAISKLTQI